MNRKEMTLLGVSVMIGLALGWLMAYPQGKRDQACEDRPAIEAAARKSVQDGKAIELMQGVINQMDAYDRARRRAGRFMNPPPSGPDDYHEPAMPDPPSPERLLPPARTHRMEKEVRRPDA